MPAVYPREFRKDVIQVARNREPGVSSESDRRRFRNLGVVSGELVGDRRTANDDSREEVTRALKRRLSDVEAPAMTADINLLPTTATSLNRSPLDMGERGVNPVWNLG